MELLKKLNFKSQKEIVIINAPEEFETALKEINTMLPVKNSLSNNKNEFVLIFVKNSKELESLINKSIKSLTSESLFLDSLSEKIIKEI